MLRKRGLSDVVTTVLIILIALGALGIIVSFLIPMIKSGSSQVTSACLSLQIESTKCTYNQVEADLAATPPTPALNTTTVLVKRNAGEAELDSIKVIFYSANGETTTGEMTEVPSLLETKAFITTEVNGPITEVAVAGVVITEGDDERICGESFRETCITQ